MTDRLVLIRRKNRAFHALTVALAALERRRHVTGHTLPEASRERLGELAKAYRLAVVAWERSRARWTG